MIHVCLNLLIKTLRENKPDKREIFADFEDCRTNGGALPPDTALTNSRPDLVIIDKSSNH